MMSKRHRDREKRQDEASDSEESASNDQNGAQNTELEPGDSVQFRYECQAALLGIVIEVWQERRNTWVTIKDDSNEFYKVKRNCVWKINKLTEMSEEESSDDEENAQLDEYDPVENISGGKLQSIDTFPLIFSFFLYTDNILCVTKIHLYIVDTSTNATRNPQESAPRHRRSSQAPVGINESTENNAVNENVIKYHGYTWEKVDSIPHSAEFACNFKDPKLSWHSSIPDVARENASEPNICFYRAFPYHKIENYCELINDALRMKNIHYRVNKGIFLKYIGIRLAMSLLRIIGGVEGAFCSTKHDEETIFEAGNFNEKYGMSKNEFKNISNAFQVCRFTDQELREVS